MLFKDHFSVFTYVRKMIKFVAITLYVLFRFCNISDIP